ncbi:DUF6442 family protein [Ruminococcus sp.]|uniref:DUF6442 family protein n=2 Tax=Ruminococcus sp. TaxID=41978 RepID=UPI001B798908|nr:DUF6442 family protein [Ruminococcus sp.]MBP5432294.1 hypothetical protein [Ruminococcus sp.]
MNKEEILEKSKNDYKKHDPIEETTMQKVYNYIYVTMAVTVSIVFFIHLFMLKRADLGLWAIVEAGVGAGCLARSKYKKKKTYITLGVMYLIIAVILIIVDTAIMVTSRE